MLLPPHCQAVLLDMDGVLINSEPVHASAVREMIRHASGTQMSEKELASLKGLGKQLLAQRIFELFPHVTQSKEEFIKYYLNTYIETFDRACPMPGIFIFLKQCKTANLLTSLTTPATASIQRLVFERFGFSSFFSTIVTATDVRNGKPDPESYLLSAARLGIVASNYVVIEDFCSEVRSGKAAGCHGRAAGK